VRGQRAGIEFWECYRVDELADTGGMSFPSGPMEWSLVILQA